MQFNLGTFLRSRYNHLIGDKYDENDIYVRASDVDRTMMSAMSNLAGLYPPKGDQIWNLNLLWQPIPVRKFYPIAMPSIILSKNPFFTSGSHSSRR